MLWVPIIVFQFHKGASKTVVVLIIARVTAFFQFHKGASKTFIATEAPDFDSDLSIP